MPARRRAWRCARKGYEVVLVQLQPRHHHDGHRPSPTRCTWSPLHWNTWPRIIRYERPDAVLPGMGGQTGLNLAMQLDKKGVLAECQRGASGHRRSAASSARRTASCSRSCAPRPGRAGAALRNGADRMEEGLKAARSNRLSRGAAPRLYFGRHGRRLCRR